MLELFMKKVNKNTKNVSFKFKTNLKAGDGGNRGNGNSQNGRDPDVTRSVLP